MKKFEQRYCVRAQSNAVQVYTQHYKLHIHENDHRFLFDHGLCGWNGLYKSGFTLVVLEHPLGDVKRRLQRQEFL